MMKGWLKLKGRSDNQAIEFKWLTSFIKRQIILRETKFDSLVEELLTNLYCIDFRYVKD